MSVQDILAKLSPEEREQMAAAIEEEKRAAVLNRREAYESLRKDFISDVRTMVEAEVERVQEFKDWLDNTCGAFKEVMAEYGQMKKDDQMNFTLTEDDFKIEIKCNKVKRFDERADMAASRLMDYLSKYIEGKDEGKDDPMYQLAMSLLSRNRQGALDYKSISKLYELENKFDEEYSEIMNLFRESNVVMATCTNYYFWKQDENGVWLRVEPSFCRL